MKLKFYIKFCIFILFLFFITKTFIHIVFTEIFNQHMSPYTSYSSKCQTSKNIQRVQRRLGIEQHGHSCNPRCYASSHEHSQPWLMTRVWEKSYWWATELQFLTFSDLKFWSVHKPMFQMFLRFVFKFIRLIYWRWEKSFEKIHAQFQRGRVFLKMWG